MLEEEEEHVETPDKDALDERVHPHWEKSTNTELRYSEYRDRLKSWYVLW